MKFKMRILHFSPAGNAEKIGEAIARSQRASGDKIPPAYPVENEKLLFLGVELKGGSVDKSVLAFCPDMTEARAKHVALYAVSGDSFAGLEEVRTVLESNGVTVLADPYRCTVKSGLFKKGSVTQQDVQDAVAWAAKLVDSL